MSNNFHLKVEAPDETEGDAEIPELVALSKWGRQIGRSRATIWRWRQLGWLDGITNIAGRPYISRQGIEKFRRRAQADEFARSPHGGAKLVPAANDLQPSDLESPIVGPKALIDSSPAAASSLAAPEVPEAVTTQTAGEDEAQEPNESYWTGELGYKLNVLRRKSKITTAELARKSEVSREGAFRHLRGSPMKFSTLKKLAKGLAVEGDDWLDLLECWIELTIGEDAKAIQIELKYIGSPRRQESSDEPLLKAIRRMNGVQREQILKVIGRPGVMACLLSISLALEATDLIGAPSSAHSRRRRLGGAGARQAHGAGDGSRHHGRGVQCVGADDRMVARSPGRASRANDPWDQL
jgi:hypothetical protein